MESGGCSNNKNMVKIVIVTTEYVKTYADIDQPQCLLLVNLYSTSLFCNHPTILKF